MKNNSLISIKAITFAALLSLSVVGCSNAQNSSAAVVTSTQAAATQAAGTTASSGTTSSTEAATTTTTIMIGFVASFTTTTTPPSSSLSSTVTHLCSHTCRPAGLVFGLNLARLALPPISVVLGDRSHASRGRLFCTLMTSSPSYL